MRRSREIAEAWLPLACCVLSLSLPATAQTQFVDVAAGVGIDDYQAQTGDGHGPGAVFADLNNDGYPDLYLMQAWGNPNRLYLNTDSGGTRVFTRAVNDAGAGDGGNATGAIAGDYDNDGDLDLYVLNFDQPNVLFQNRLIETGSLSFVDVTASTDPTPGVTDDQLGVGNAVHDGVTLDNSLTAAWADPDRDGDLDLYVGTHNGYFGDPVESPAPNIGRRDAFYRNNSDGTFTDVTMTLGIPGYESLTGDHITAVQRFSSSNAVVFADVNNDLWPDLIVTNKVGGPPDYDMLYLNQGEDEGGNWLGFDCVTYTMPTQFGDRSGGAMGVDVGDPDHDGDLDIYITDWSDLSSPSNPGSNDAWINQLTETGQLDFIYSAGLPAKFSWGTVFQDFDNDGWEDLHVACESGAPDHLYRNVLGSWVEEAQAAGVDSTEQARGDLSADYDRDGWPDLLVVRPWGPPSSLWENRSDQLSPERHFLSVKLIGDPSTPGPHHSTRDAIGARMNITADLDGDQTIEAWEVQRRDVVSGNSNAASTSSLELEVGLGAATTATLEVLWPSGRRSIYQRAADQFVTLGEAVQPASVGGLRVSRLDLSWGGLTDVTGYDVVEGDLDVLRATGGDFAAAAMSCVVADHPDASLSFTSEPGPGAARFLLVRSVNGHRGSWDSGGTTQVASRDPGWAGCP